MRVLWDPDRGGRRWRPDEDGWDDTEWAYDDGDQESLYTLIPDPPDPDRL
jgi:hypothetical protein